MMLFVLMIVLSSMKAQCPDGEGGRACLCCKEKFFHDQGVYAFSSTQTNGEYQTVNDACEAVDLTSYIVDGQKYVPATYQGDVLTPTLKGRYNSIIGRGKTFLSSFKLNTYYPYMHWLTTFNKQIRWGNFEENSGDQCSFSTSIMYHKLRINGKNVTPNFRLGGWLYPSSFGSCRYIQCLYEIRELSSPFCTNSGYYETKELYCQAFDDFKDVSASTGCPEIRYGCDAPTNSKVCTDNHDLLTHSDACKYLKHGYINKIITCESGSCELDDCYYNRCYESITKQYCSLMKLCSISTAHFYQNAEEFCKANPTLGVSHIYQIKGNQSQADTFLEPQDASQCCNLVTNRYFCDPNQNYRVKPINNDCNSPRVFTEQELKEYHFIRGNSQYHCDRFKDCMEYMPDYNNFCTYQGNFFENKIEFCKVYRYSFKTTQLSSCTINGVCNTKQECKIGACYHSSGQALKDEYVYPTGICSYNFHELSSRKDICFYVAGMSKELLLCDGEVCTGSQCLLRKDKEEREVALPVCHPKIYQPIETVEDVAKAMEEDQLPFKDFPLCEAETCSELTCFLQICQEKIKLTGKVCHFDRVTQQVSLHDDVEAYCIVAADNKHPDYADFVKDGTGFSNADECYSSSCPNGRYSICSPETGLVLTPLEFCFYHEGDSTFESAPNCGGIGTRDCVQDDCCPMVDSASNSMDKVCLQGVGFLYQYQFCKKQTEYGALLPINIPTDQDSFCGSDGKLYDWESLCNAYNDNAAIGIDPCPGCTPVDCCERQLSNSSPRVVVEIINGVIKVFDNICRAKEEYPNKEILRTCAVGDTEAECYLKGCEMGICDGVSEAKVCGVDGNVYENTCVMKCEGVALDISCADLERLVKKSNSSSRRRRRGRSSSGFDCAAQCSKLAGP